MVKFVGGDLLRVVVRESQDAKRIGVTKNPRQKNYCNLNFGRFNSISISAERRNNISFAPAPGNLNQDFQFLAAAEEPTLGGRGIIFKNWPASHCHLGASTSMPYPLFGARDVPVILKKMWPNQETFLAGRACNLITI